MFPSAFPVDVGKLVKLYSTGEYSDIKIYLSDHSLTFQSHKVILSLWSVAFAKVRISFSVAVLMYMNILILNFLIYSL